MTDRAGAGPAGGERAAAVTASPRLFVYAVVGAGSLLLGLVAGRPGMAVFGAPLVVLAFAAVAIARPPSLSLAAHWSPEQLVDGDDLELVITGRLDPRMSRLDVLAACAGPAEPERPDCSFSAVLTNAANPAVRLPATAVGWGLARVDQLAARASGPLGLVRWTWTLPARATARVLPHRETLRDLLHPEARAVAGSHPSRARATGLDFAELRPLAPGDRLADVNWLASARRRRLRPSGAGTALDLVVTMRHPDRTGDVIVLLDTLADDRVDAAPWLHRSVRAAWAIARAHLAAQDRVGLVALGGFPRWVVPGTGRRAEYTVLDGLLRAQASWSAVDRTLTGTPVHLLPPGAVIVALSPLHDPRFVEAVIDLRRQGRDVALLAIDASSWLPPLSGTAALAARLWVIDLDERVEVLERAGVPVVRWQEGEPVAGAVALLGRRRRAPVKVRR